MKHCRYHPEFNWQVYGAAEKRADQYWKQRKLSQVANKSDRENHEKSPQIAGRRKISWIKRNAGGGDM